MKHLVILLSLLLASSVEAATLRVPEQYATIQEGIDAAVNGDTVLVGPGVYNEHINFQGKAILVSSLDGPEVTILERATPDNPLVRFNHGEDTTSILNGLTIQNTLFAHGIEIVSASPIIQNCIIRNCHWLEDGGAIQFYFSAAKIRYNRIYSNHGVSTGGGLGGGGALSRPLEIVGNEIYDNHTANGVGIGSPPGGLNAIIERNIIRDNIGDSEVASAIYVYQCIDCRIYNNTIVRNTKGISIYSGAADIQNNIIVGNLQEAFYPIDLGDYNDVWNNGSHNYIGPNGISADPLFYSYESHDFRLQSYSPCIDAGNPNIEFNDPDDSRNDIGALPFVSLLSFDLIAPLADSVITDSYPAFLWGGLVDTSDLRVFTFVVMWSDDPSFTESDSSPVLDDTSWVSTTAFAPLKRWYWKVQAHPDSGSPFWSSSVGTFVIDYIPSLPSVFQPDDSAEILSDGWLLWIESVDSDINDTIWYNVQIAANSFFEPPLCNVTIREDSLGPSTLGPRDAITGLQVGSIVGYENLADDSCYHWRVRSIDSYGGASAFSSGPHVFFLNKANTPPQAVSTTIYPKSGEIVNDLTPAISWMSAIDSDLSDDAGQLRYFVQVDDSPDFAGPEVKSYWTAYGQPSVEVDYLSDELLYYYRIQTADDDGALSVWSATYDFWTNWRNDFPSNFDLAFPRDNTFSVDVYPQLVWNPAEDNDPLDRITYSLVMALDSGFVFKVEFSGIADTVYILTAPLSYETDYWWKVKAVDLYDGTTWSSETFRFKTSVPGDADGNGTVNISDVVFLINYIFAGGAAPNPLLVGDANCSGGINISDAVYLIQYIFAGGPAPCEP